MKTDLAEYVRLLQSELDDLYRQAENGVRDYMRRKEQWAVTEHVFLENVELLQNEERCLRRFREILDETDLAKFDNLPDLQEGLRKVFRRHVEEAGCAPCTMLLVEMRMEKVMQTPHNAHKCVA